MLIYAIVLLACYFTFAFTWMSDNEPPPARIRPQPIPFDRFRETCVSQHESLTGQEILTCEYYTAKPQDPVLLDFFAPVCGYQLDCSKDPAPVPKTCPLAVGSGILFESFAQESLQSVKVEGVWQAGQRTLLCLRDQVNMTKYIQYGFY
jgi:hypothetical protein